MIEKGTYVELAKANAAAVNGMQPKISVWNTGSEAGSSAAGSGRWIALGSNEAGAARSAARDHEWEGFLHPNLLSYPLRSLL